VFTPRPDPVVVVPDGAGAGGLLDRLHAVGDPFCLLRPGQVVLPLPAAAVRAGLVAASDDLRGDLRVQADRVADHERSHLDLVLVQQVQDAGHALARPVLVEGVLPQVGEAIQDRLGDRAAGAADRLAAGLELHGHAHRQTCAVWPELVLLRHPALLGNPAGTRALGG
jgi:hypothetical protein